MNGPATIFQGVFTRDTAISSGATGIPSVTVGVLGQGAGTAVQGRQIEGNSQSDSSCHIFTSQQEADNFFGAGLQGTLQGGLASLQDKLSYSRQMNITTGDTVILVSAYQKITISGVSASPLPGITTDPNSFIQQYGDSYVSQVTLGGFFFGYYKLLTSRVSNGTDISNQISASLSNGVLSGSVSNTINSVISQHNNIMAQVEEAHIIGMAGVALPPSNDFVNFALQFPAMRLNAPALLEFAAQPYSIAGISI